MAIVYNSLFSPNPISLPTIKPNTKTILLNPNNLPSIPISHKTQRRNLPLPAVASIPYPPINVDYLESEFNGHGVSFKGIGERCVVKLGLENGSVATLMLPSGMITSYKARMWHGGLLEVLHTLVTEGEDGAVIQGGVTLAFKFQGDEGESWSPSNWALLDVKGNPQESIQVELISTNSEDMVEVKHIVTLKEDEISSEIVIKNSKDSSLCFLGSVMSHLVVSTPDATYAVGLENSNFFNKPPVLSDFTIMPTNFSLRNDLGSTNNFWGRFGFKEFFEGRGAKTENNVDIEESEDTEEGEELEGEEEDDYKHLTNKLSRVYTSAPRSFTVMDRGRRNSVVIGRDGFKEMYMFSPGSTYEWYSKYAYICIGQSALLEPVILAPKGEWRGAQHLHNPNM